MRVMTTFFFLSFATLVLLSTNKAEAMMLPDVPRIEGPIPMKARSVELKKNEEGNFRLFIDSTETPIRGAGGVFAPGMLQYFRSVGGNFTRTWGIDSLESPVHGGEKYIDCAYRIGVNVVAGIWLGHERHGFDYGNSDNIQEQREAVLEAVRKYKSHPGVVMWGLGNEMEDPVSQTGKPSIWRELEILAKIIKKEDPHRPIMTVIAGTSPQKVKSLIKYCPSIDVLGVNAYSSAGGSGESLRSSGWKKPFSVTEFGVRGFWEVPTTSWGAPLEPTSTEKARTYYASHMMVAEMNKGSELCLGTFAFLWGWKQEKTSTWFGMYLPTMEKLPQVDAMVKAWTGAWPKNRCPVIEQVDADFFGKKVKASQKLSAQVKVREPEGDSLSYEWVVTEESKAHSTGGDREYEPPSFPALTVMNSDGKCEVLAPANKGAYRLFLTVRDQKGSAATANIPFYVE
ncbi:MAG: hypothetical protein HQL32_12210 [Planctomycetes bacterium]|nr:hypothetical protein [Planctomycetota bacterium]